jgi:hypothetical protein
VHISSFEPPALTIFAREIKIKILKFCKKNEKYFCVPSLAMAIYAWFLEKKNNMTMIIFLDILITQQIYDNK